MRAIMILLFATTAHAQVTCPAISWVSAATSTMATPANASVSVLQRLTDGSFTRRNYRGFTPQTLTQQPPVPRFEQSYYQCQGLTPPAPQMPVGWLFGGDRMPGVSSHPVVGGSFLGNGTAFGACVRPCTTNNKLLAATFSADGTLTASNSYDVGPNPAGVLAADLNGDSRPDVIVLNEGNYTTIKGSLSIFLTNANGTLSGPSTVQLSTDLRKGAAADIDNDGKIDVVLAVGTNNFLWLKGNGNGTLAAPVAIATPGPSYGIAAADFTGDGKVDVLVAGTSSMSVMPGNANGTFGAAKTSNPGGFISMSNIGMGDFNRDGKLDVATTGGSFGEVKVMLGNGDGTFGAPSYYVTPNEDEYFYVMDFDWDGKPDIVMGEGHPDGITPGAYSPNITVLFGKGDGTFHAMRGYGTPGTIQSLAVGDLNGDNKPDVVSTAFNSLTIHLGNAGGALQQGVTLTGSFRAAALADLNRDGKLDIAATGNNAILTYQGNGDGTFQAAVTTTVGRTFDLIAAGDLNGDTVIDLVAGESSTGTITVYTRSAGGALAAGASFVSGSKPKEVQLADLNGDSRLDLVVTNYGTLFTAGDIGGVAVYLGNGNGTFGQGTTYNHGVNPNAVSLADVNGDGRLDLLTAAESNSNGNGAYRLHIAMNQGNGTFGAPAVYTVDFGPGNVVFADFNLDSRKDLIVRHCCGQTDLGFMAGNGNGTFQPETMLIPSGQDQRHLLMVDWNNDGKPGLLVGTDDRLIAFVNRTATGASLTSPAPGATLSQGAVTFTWGAVAGATKYRLDVGTTAGSANLFTQETTATTLAVSNLPADGRTLYVQVTAFVNGAYGTPGTATYRAYTTPVPLRFVPLAPCRLMETRALYNFEGRTGAFGPPALTAGSTRTLNPPASNVCSIPSNAKAYVVNVTVIPSGAVDYVTLWAAGDPQPNTWTIRSPDGQTVANTAIVKAGTNGGISVYSSSNTDLLIDISGYFTDSTAVSGLVYYPLTPCRVIDTRIVYRSPAGPFGPPSLAAQQTRRFAFPSTPYCSVPQAAAYSMTITAVPPAPLAFLTIWPATTAQPGVSSINSFAGRVLANSVILPSTNGALDVYAYNNTDFLVDINGYFAPDNGQGLSFFTVPPCRASDSTVSGGVYAADSTRSINIPAAAGCSGIPANARGYAINVTALPNGNPLPFLTAYPTGQPRPGASILNAFEGQIVSNSAIIPAGTNGAIDIYAYTQTNVVVEVSGYFGRQ